MIKKNHFIYYIAFFFAFAFGAICYSICGFCFNLKIAKTVVGPVGLGGLALAFGGLGMAYWKGYLK